MTLDETIKRVEEIAEEHEKKALLYSNDPFGFYKDTKAWYKDWRKPKR